MEIKMNDNNDDFLLVDVDSAAASREASKNNGRKSTKKDPAIWLLPNIKNATKTYDAMVRLMPRGVDGLKNKMHPTVPHAVHYVKDPELNLFITIPCRKTLGASEICPYCQKQRTMFFNAKNNGDADGQKKWDKRQANTTHIGNFLIRQDLVNPANNGKVKLWEHTNAINNKLFEPTKPEDKTKQGLKKVQRFNPYSPINGRDFLVIVRQSTKNPEWPDYSESTWDETASDLAPSRDEIIALLDQTHDLQRFLDEVPSIEQINEMMFEYDERVSKAEAQLKSGGIHTSSAFASHQVNQPVANASTFLNTPKVESPKATTTQPVAQPVESASPDIFNLNNEETGDNSDNSDIDDLPF